MKWVARSTRLQRNRTRLKGKVQGPVQVQRTRVCTHRAQSQPGRHEALGGGLFLSGMADRLLSKRFYSQVLLLTLLHLKPGVRVSGYNDYSCVLIAQWSGVLLSKTFCGHSDCLFRLLSASSWQVGPQEPIEHKARLQPLLLLKRRKNEANVQTYFQKSSQRQGFFFFLTWHFSGSSPICLSIFMSVRSPIPLSHCVIWVSVLVKIRL